MAAAGLAYLLVRLRLAGLSVAPKGVFARGGAADAASAELQITKSCQACSTLHELS